MDRLDVFKRFANGETLTDAEMLLVRKEIGRRAKEIESVRVEAAEEKKKQKAYEASDDHDVSSFLAMANAIVQSRKSGRY